LWWGANSVVIADADTATYNRLRIIDFPKSIPRKEHSRPGELFQDKNAKDEILREESSGILNKLIAGCLEYQRIGLAEPRSVLDAVRKMQEKQDTFQQFLDATLEKVVDDPLWGNTKRPHVKSGDLYERYRRWMKEEGQKWLSPKDFHTVMSKRFEDGRVYGKPGNFWFGLRFIEP
jgi:putative DNA primase/helicase